MLKTVIIHYHLQPGGVTKVIANQLQALACAHDEPIDALLIYSGAPTGLPEDLASIPGLELHHAIIPELAYDTHHQAGAADLVTTIAAACTAAGFSPAESLLHIHNHSLGKNGALTAAVPLLAASGWRLLLQLHDFAEDFRPNEFGHLRDRAELRHGTWYPQAPHIHYATLNARDHAFLRRAGIDHDRLHLLPNPVLPDAPGDPELGRSALTARFNGSLRDEYTLYPVRGIARKQLGEFLLHAALAEDHQCYGISLAPANPWQRPSYDRWRDLARSCALPCLFETGATEALTFHDHIAAADHILTTSVAEGFGMAFLESCLSGHLITGRDLVDITRDFHQDGLQFPGLRERMLIPVDWIGRDTWSRDLITSYRAVLDSYRQDLPNEDSLLSDCSQLIDGEGLIDFATCTMDLQARIVTLVSADPARRDDLRRINPPPLRHHSACNLDLIRQNNSRAVKQAYSMQAIGTRLCACYASLCAADCISKIEALRGASALLDGFLDLARFAPIRIQQG